MTDSDITMFSMYSECDSDADTVVLDAPISEDYDTNGALMAIRDALEPFLDIYGLQNIAKINKGCCIQYGKYCEKRAHAMIRSLLHGDTYNVMGSFAGLNMQATPPIFFSKNI